MVTRYNIYSGDNSGGPVNYAAPVATVDTPTWQTAALPVPSRTRFGVRAVDDITKLEEHNIDCVYEVTINDQGINVSERPPAPIGLQVEARGTDGVLIRWTYLYRPPLPDPDSFVLRVQMGTMDFNLPGVLVAPFASGQSQYQATVAGLDSGASYAVSVRSALGPAEDSNTAVLTVQTRSAPPKNPADLMVTATHKE